jgi:hypothetical protein
MTIKGAKKHLQKQKSDLDENDIKTIKAEFIKNKLNKISNLIKKIKI